MDNAVKGLVRKHHIIIGRSKLWLFIWTWTLRSAEIFLDQVILVYTQQEQNPRVRKAFMIRRVHLHLKTLFPAVRASSLETLQGISLTVSPGLILSACMIVDFHSNLIGLQGLTPLTVAETLAVDCHQTIRVQRMVLIIGVLSSWLYILQRSIGLL